MTPAIDIRDLSVVIDRQTILSDISCTIMPGRIVGLLGPSGAGKTTLIRTLLGLQGPSAGSVTVTGLVPGAKQARMQVGYVSQAPSVYMDLSVWENITYFAALLGISESIATKVLQDVELQEYKNHAVSDLSGGQRTRVSLAIALLGSPKIMLLDEPTVGLDPVLRQKLWKQFKQLADAGTTLLISSHVMDEADRCDELLFMRNGRLLATGTKHSILTQTNAHSMEEAFIQLAGSKPQ
jgi:ABC-2 type transport system ATP-binding protein